MRIAKLVMLAGAVLALLLVGQSDADYRDEVLALNPVGYWEFNGDATDSTANGNDLTLMANATTPATGGIIGGALDLPGPLAPDGGSCFDCGLRLSEHVDGAYVLTPEGNPLNFTTPAYSIVAWIYPAFEKDPLLRDPEDPTGITGTMKVLNKRRATNWSSDGGWWDYGMWLAGSTANDINDPNPFSMTHGYQTGMVTTGNNPTGDDIRLTSPADNTLPTGIAKSWHMVSMVWNQGEGEGNATVYYFDGEFLSETSALSDAILSGSAHELLIGARAVPPSQGGSDDFPGDNWIGRLDEVAVFDTALTDEDMSTLFAAATVVTGDMDCDGDIDFDDIDDFVLGLNNPVEYESNMGVPASLKGDTDGDGDLDFDDITGFVDILSGGIQSVPEPSTLVLLGASGLLGVWMMLRRRR